jgi:anti-anti-sigma regulatory factor
MRNIDGSVASTIVRTASALRLLGAEVVLTGVRPAMAQALVGLEVGLAGMVTRGTLQSGIAYAMQRIANRR